MLQQTKVATVKDYFNRWMLRFPTALRLAEAPVEEVLEAWAGLGYYRRARNIHATAVQIAESGMPQSRDEWMTMPGVGRYTASAVSSMTTGERVTVVDGNVSRIISRIFGLYCDVTTGSGQKEIWQVADSLLPERSFPGDFNEAMMEFGALQCVPKSPNCTDCILKNECVAYSEGLVATLPIRNSRKKQKRKMIVETAYCFTNARNEVLLAKRLEKGLYAGLWEFPMASTQEELESELLVPISNVSKPLGIVEKKLSHRVLKITLVRASLEARKKSPHGTRYQALAWYSKRKIEELAISSTTVSILRLLEKK